MRSPPGRAVSGNLYGTEQIRVYSDSQLIVNQVLRQYEARENNMVAYLSLVHKIARKLKGMSITQKSQKENIQADLLAHLT